MVRRQAGPKRAARAFLAGKELISRVDGENALNRRVPRDRRALSNEGRGPMHLMWLVILAGLLAVAYGIMTVMELLKADPGSARMQEIAAAIAEGAQAYLKRQYTTIAIVGAVIFVILGL